MAELPPLVATLWSSLMGFYEMLNDFNFGDNNGIDYIAVPIYLILLLLIFYSTKYIVLRRLKNWLHSRYSHTDSVSIVIHGIQDFLSWPFIFLMSIYLSTLHLSIPGSIETIIDGIVLAVIFYFIYSFVSQVVDTASDYQETRTEQDTRHITEFFRLIAKSIVIVLLGIWYLSNLGMDVSGFVASVGILGIAVAFALQNVLSDLLASITIYLDKPFEIGDFVVIDNDVKGEIERIGVRSTHIRSLEGQLVVLSNQTLISSKIDNYKKMETRRVEQTISVSAETEVEKLRQLPDAIEDLFDDLPNTRFERVHLVNLGEYSWDYELIYHIMTKEIMVYKDTLEELNLRILELMEEKDIILPYPVRQIILDHKDDTDSSQTTILEDPQIN